MLGSFMVQQQPFITVCLDFRFPVSSCSDLEVCMLLRTYYFFQVVKFVVFYCLYLCNISPPSFLNLFVSVLSFFLNESKGLSILTFQKSVFSSFFFLVSILFISSVICIISFLLFFLCLFFIFLIPICGRLFFYFYFFLDFFFFKQAYKLST